MPSPERLPLWRVLLIFIIAAIVLGIAVWQLLKPIERRVAVRYINRGDSHMLGLDFDQAQEEYRQAVKLDSHSATAAERLRLAEQAPTDIAAARSFYADREVTSVVSKIDTAKTDFTDPKKALEQGVLFYETGDLSYARYPIERAVQLDPGYPEAWHYLSLVYDGLAKFDAGYRQKAEDARQHRDALTPRYLKGTAW